MFYGLNGLKGLQPKKLSSDIPPDFAFMGAVSGHLTDFALGVPHPDRLITVVLVGRMSNQSARVNAIWFNGTEIIPAQHGAWYSGSTRLTVAAIASARLNGDKLTTSADTTHTFSNIYTIVYRSFTKMRPVLVEPSTLTTNAVQVWPPVGGKAALQTLVTADSGSGSISASYNVNFSADADLTSITGDKTVIGRIFDTKKETQASWSPYPTERSRMAYVLR